MLEQRIEELTEAVRALTEVLLNSISVPQVMTLEKPEQVTLPAEVVAEMKATATVKVEDLPVDPAVTYDDVKNSVIAVSKVSKAKAVAALGRFGVKTAKELTEGQWADFVAYMTRVQAGEVDPEASE